MILFIFEDEKLRQTEQAERLEEAFYWGVTFPEETLRAAFFTVWEQRMPSSLVARLSFLLRDQVWTYMRDECWLKHFLHLLIRCLQFFLTIFRCLGEDGGRQTLNLVQGASFWNSFALSSKLDLSVLVCIFSSSNVQSLEEEEPMDVDEMPDYEGQETSTAKRLEVFLKEQSSLLREASDFRFQEVLPQLCSLLYSGLSSFIEKCRRDNGLSCLPSVLLLYLAESR